MGRFFGAAIAAVLLTTQPAVKAQSDSTPDRTQERNALKAEYFGDAGRSHTRGNGEASRYEVAYSRALLELDKDYVQPLSQNAQLIRQGRCASAECRQAFSASSAQGEILKPAQSIRARPLADQSGVHAIALRWMPPEWMRGGESRILRYEIAIIAHNQYSVYSVAEARQQPLEVPRRGSTWRREGGRVVRDEGGQPTHGSHHRDRVRRSAYIEGIEADSIHVAVQAVYRERKPRSGSTSQTGASDENVLQIERSSKISFTVDTVGDVQFDDTDLRDCVVGSHSKGTRTPIEEVTALDCSLRNISSLGGLEHFQWLEALNLFATSVSGIGPLSELSSLQALNLGQTSVTNIDDLGALPNLRYLYLSSTPVSSIQEITGVSTLEELSLHGSDVHVIPDMSATGLTYLDASDNPLVDVSGIREIDTLETLILSRDASGGGEQAEDAFGDISALVDNASSVSGSLSKVDLRGNPQIYCFHLQELDAALGASGGTMQSPDRCSDIPVPTEIGGAPQISEFNDYVVSWNGEGQLADSYFRLEERVLETDHEVTYSSDDPQLDMSENSERRVGIFQYRVQLCHETDSNCSGWSTPYDQIVMASPAVPGDEVLQEIPDPALQACVASHLEYETDPGEIAYLSNGEITSLVCSSWGIDDLSGFEFFPNLKYLSLPNNGISDLAPLELLLDVASAALSPLTISLPNNQITSSQLSHVAVPGALTNLRLAANDITDIDALGNLDSLTTLDLDDNDVVDLSPISEVSILGLHVERNGIASIPDLSGTDFIQASGNEITDVTGLWSVKSSLNYLDLSDNPVSSSDLSGGFTDWTNLEWIYLSRTDVEGVDFLSDAPELKYLEINETDVSSLTGIETLSLLERVTARSTDIDSLTAIEGAENLTHLEVTGGSLAGPDALDPIASLEGLATLVLANNGVTNVAPVVELVDSPPPGGDAIPSLFGNRSIDLSGERHIFCGDVHEIYQAGVLSINAAMSPECQPDNGLTSTAWLTSDFLTFELTWDRSLVPPGYFGTSMYEIEYTARDGTPVGTTSVEGAERRWTELTLPDAFDEQYEFRVRPCRSDGVCGQYPTDRTVAHYPLVPVTEAEAVLADDGTGLLTLSYDHPVPTPQAELEVEVSSLFESVETVTFPYESGQMQWPIEDVRAYPGGILRLRVCRTVAGERDCGPTRDVRAIQPELDPEIPAPEGLAVGDDGGRLRLDHGEHFLSWEPVDDPRVDYYRVQRSISIVHDGNTYEQVEYDFNIEAPKVDLRRFDGDPDDLTSYQVQACDKVEGSPDLCSESASTEPIRIDGVDSVVLSAPTDICWFWSESDDVDNYEFSLRWTYPDEGFDAPRYFKNINHDTQSPKIVPYNDSSGLLENDSGEKVPYWERKGTTAKVFSLGSNAYVAEVSSSFRGKVASYSPTIQNEVDGERVWNQQTRCDEDAVVQGSERSDTVGPQSLSPGHYATWSGGDGSEYPGGGTGWSFYWTKWPRVEDVNDSFGRSYDLLAFWYTYRKLEGDSELTPVWYYARLYQTDPEDDSYVSGTLMYPQSGYDADGQERNDVSVGEVRINFESDRQQAEVDLDIRQDSHLTSFSIAGTPAYESFNIRDMSTNDDLFESPEDLGEPNPTDHYSGIWTPDPDAPFSELDQILEENEAFFSEWIVGNFASIGVKGFDQGGEPIWFIEFKCEHSDPDGDHCYSGDDPIDFSLSRHMDELNTVFPGPGTGPLDPMTEDQRSEELETIPAGGSGLRRSFNDAANDEPHTAQRRGTVCVDLTGSLPAEGENDPRPYEIQIGYDGGESCVGSSDSAEEPITKIANLHYMQVILNGDPDSLTCTAQQQSDGACTAELTWFTDAHYPTARPFVTVGGQGLQPIEDVCENPINWDGLSPYEGAVECELGAPGDYRFHLVNRLEFGNALGDNSGEIATTRPIFVESDIENVPVSAPQIPFEPEELSQNQLEETSKVGSAAGEFEVNETGSALYTIPIMTAPAPGDVAPVLSVVYNSSADGGRLGPGWDISGLSTITRCRQTIEAGDEKMGSVDFGSEDRFCLDGARLKMTDGSEYGAPDTTYRLEVDDSTRIEAIGEVQGEPAYFRVHGADGSVRVFGSQDAQSSARIAATDSGEIVAWPVSEFKDSASNYYTYTYFRKDFSDSPLPSETLEWGIESISYTGNDEAGTTPFATIEFIYQDLPSDQQMTTYFGTVPIAKTKVIGRIQSIHDEGVLRDYRLFYADTGAAQNKYVLEEFHECWDANSEKDDTSSCFEPTTFEWIHDSRDIESSPSYSIDEVRNLKAIRSGDMNADGRRDVVYYAEGSADPDWPQALYIGLSDEEGGLSFLDPFVVSDCFADRSGVNDFFLADPFGEGANSIFFAADCGSGLKVWRRSLSEENELTEPEAVVDLNVGDLSEEAVVNFVDWSGDGVLDLIVVESGNVPQMWYARNETPAPDGNPFPELSEVSFDNFGDWWEDACPEDKPNIEHEDHDIDLVTRSPFSYRGSARASFLLSHRVDLYCNSDEPDSSQEGPIVPDATPGPVFRIASIVPPESEGGEPGQDVVIEGSSLFPESTHVVVGDINSDGYSDFVYFTEDDDAGDGVRKLNVAINKGGALQLIEAPGSGSAIETDAEIQYLARLVDYDGDGYLDLLLPSGTVEGGTYWEVYLWEWNDGEGGFAQTPVQGPYVGNLGIGGSGKAFFADLNGNSRRDYLIARKTGTGQDGPGVPVYSKHSIAMHLASTDPDGGAEGPPGKIVSFSNGFGAWTQIEYKPLTDPGVYQRGYTSNNAGYGRGSFVFDSHPPRFVVSSVVSGVPQHELDASAAGLDYQYNPDAAATVRYHYSGARIQAGGRGYLGFRRVSTYDAQSGVLSATKYSQDFPYIGRPESTRTWHLESGPWAGTGSAPNLPDWPSMADCDEVTHTPSSGALLTGCSENLWDFVRQPDNDIPDEEEEWTDNPMAILFLSNTEEWNIEAMFSDGFRSGELTHRVVTSRSEVDQFGNPGKVEKYTYSGDDYNPVESKVSQSFYDNRTDEWHLGRMICMRVETERMDAPEELEPAVRTSGFGYDQGTGLLNKEVVEPENCECSLASGPPSSGACSDEGILVREHAHDEFGNRLRTEKVAYDEDSGAVEERRLKGRSFGARGALVSTEYEGVGYTGGVWQTAITSDYLSYDQFGNPGIVEEPGGLQIEKSYDLMGRPLQTWSQTGSFSRTIREMPEHQGDVLPGCPAGTAFKETITDGTGARSQVCKDILGRDTRERTMGFSDLELDSGQTEQPWINVDTHYDYASRVVEQSAPYFAVIGGDNPESAVFDVFWTRKLHDELGRIIEVTRPIGPNQNASETIVHDGLTTTTINDQGQERVVERNVLGDKVLERSPSEAVTEFRYNHLGELVVTDGPLQGDVDEISLEYDQLGHKASLSDPDKGDWSYQFDALGNLQYQIDAKGQATVFEYDFAGRKTRRLEYAPSTESSPSCDPDEPFGLGDCILRKDTSWTYGEPGSAEYGRVVHTTTIDVGPDGDSEVEVSETFDHDWAGRLYQKTTKFDDSAFPIGAAPEFVERFTYDKYGREFQHFDAGSNFDLGPDDCAVSSSQLNLPDACLAGGKGTLKVYNLNGHVSMLKEAGYSGTNNLEFDEATYWSINRKDARGNVVDAVMGNQHNVGADYSPATGWLEARHDYLGQETAQAITYNWDSIGRLESRSDLVTATHGEVFLYDEENRLEAVRYSPTGDAEDLVTRQRVQYDAAGNVKCKSDVYGTEDQAGNCSGGSGAPGEYAYDYQERPHAVVQAGNRTFEYDENGNVIRDFADESSELHERTYRYSVADRLQSVAHDGSTTSFFYGASRGKKVKRIEVSGVPDPEWTFYVGSVEITQGWSELNTQDSSTEVDGRVRRYIADIVVVEEESGDRRLAYLHKNHQGSIVAVSGRFGDVKEHMRYDAWGARREIDQLDMQAPRWTESIEAFVLDFLEYTDRGYTGHEHVDHAGIIHMEGRIYDPILGRFLQADPLVEDITTLNRYTYVHNNPLAYVDPNGFLSIGNLIKGLVAAAIGIATGYGAIALAGQGYVGTAVAVAAIGGAATGRIATGTREGTLQGAFRAVAMLGVSQYLSQYLRGKEWAFEGGGITTEGRMARSVGLGLASGVSADLSGGKFGHAFLQAGVSSMVSPGISGMSNNDFGNALAAGLLGGSLSEVTGGKFANGAATAAMSYAFGQVAQKQAGDGVPEFDLNAAEGRQQYANWIWGNRDRFGIEVPDGTSFEYVDDYVMWTPMGRVTCDGPCQNTDNVGRFEMAGEYLEGANRIRLYRGAFSPWQSTWMQQPGGNPTSIRGLNMSPSGSAVWTLGHEAAHARGIDLQSGPYDHLQAEYHGYQALRQYRSLRGN